MAREMSFIPAGTIIAEPDGINRVMLMFETQEAAIIFYEMLVSVSMGEQKLTLLRPTASLKRRQANDPH